MSDKLSYLYLMNKAGESEDRALFLYYSKMVEQARHEELASVPVSYRKRTTVDRTD